MIICVFLTPAFSSADTVIMKDRKKAKGLVVDEYVDRITLSTVDGEIDIFKKDIERIEYDSPEYNFMQLGRAYDAKGWYDKAAFYYKKAMDANPNYKEAREAYIASHAKMWRQEEVMTKKEMDRRNMVMNWRADQNKKDKVSYTDKMSLLKKVIGFSLLEKDGIFIVDEVSPYSNSANLDIEKGDILVGIWGRLIRYSKLEDVIDELLGPKYSEVRVLMEKNIRVLAGEDLYKELDMSLGLQYEGLVIDDIVPDGKAEEFGFKKGDFVIAIDENTTRYLPIEKVIDLINSRKEERYVIFTVRRNINLRREGE